MQPNADPTIDQASPVPVAQQKPQASPVTPGAAQGTTPVLGAAAGLPGNTQGTTPPLTAPSATPPTPTPVPVNPSAPQLTGPTTQNYIGANGQPQSGTAPAGTPYYNSSPLVNGGTATAAATPTNAFQGYTSAQGGGFGGYDPAFGNAAKTAQDALGSTDWSKIDVNTLNSLLTNHANANGAQENGYGAALQKLMNGGQLSPEEQALIHITRGDANPGLQHTADGLTFDPAAWAAKYGSGSSGTPPVGEGPIGGVDDPRNPNHFGTPTDPAGKDVAGMLGSATATDLGGMTPVGGATLSGTSGPPVNQFGLPDANGNATTGGTLGAATGAGGPTLTPTDPNNALTNQTITAGPLADRFKIANDKWNAFQQSTDPAYQASLRDAERYGAANGMKGSGQLRTEFGNLANNRNLQLDTQKSNFLSDALTGSIGDEFAKTGIAQQQQGFQNQQQQQAFGNNVTQQQLQESLTNGSFQRALQQLMAGNSGNPSDVLMMLSQIFGQQATGAGQAASNYARGSAQQAGTNSQYPAWLQQWLTSQYPASTGQSSSAGNSDANGYDYGSGGFYGGQ